MPNMIHPISDLINRFLGPFTITATSRTHSLMACVPADRSPSFCTRTNHPLAGSPGSYYRFGNPIGNLVESRAALPYARNCCARDIPISLCFQLLKRVDQLAFSPHDAASNRAHSRALSPDRTAQWLMMLLKWSFEVFDCVPTTNYTLSMQRFHQNAIRDSW
ncbi:uncharacterized protein EI90DRAFT_2487216 [Cantharellus anzutake]|uniref:uncharacterized protein n=1 Tax=Cantharellus anzutake TaxID=1750568 RepID=UPI0019078458|nr:uncharacterized protein EI90DRAFT_2487216 [Cantharellus anzutake]KAF8321974.1 hypothetical protein EI90DRAFT_2487216 [Cantharellus anzutake]